jgi:hypothetical protein
MPRSRKPDVPWNSAACVDDIYDMTYGPEHGSAPSGQPAAGTDEPPVLRLVPAEEVVDDDSLASARSALRASLFETNADGSTDTTQQLVRLLRAADREGHSPVLRRLLALVAVQIGAFAAAGLLDEGQRQPAVFAVAYAAGLLLAVSRPARARTMLSVSIVLVVAEVVTLVLDAATRRATTSTGIPLLLEVTSTWLLWMLTRSDLTDHPAPAPEPPPVRERLRLVTTLRRDR